jgi:hypothetical protein
METRQRAPRFPIRTSLLFRERGESEWRPASTLNISRSGLLFRADGLLPRAGHSVDFIVTMPLDDVMPAPHVRCMGRVVRIAPEALAERCHAVAVTIDGYAFEGRPPV